MGLSLDMFGNVDPESLPAMTHVDPFVNFLRELVDSDQVVEVRMTEGPEFVVDPDAPEDLNRMADEVRLFWYNEGGDLFLGMALPPKDGSNPHDTGFMHSTTDRFTVFIANLTAAPLIEIDKTLAHELLCHALLYVRGQPFLHNDPGVDDHIRDVIKRYK